MGKSQSKPDQFTQFQDEKRVPANIPESNTLNIPNNQINPSFPNNNPYGYKPPPNPRSLNIYQNSRNTATKIYISRNCISGFLKNEFCPEISGNRLMKEDIKEIEKINDSVSNFKIIKCLYILLILNLITCFILGIIGISIEPNLGSKQTTTYKEDLEISNLLLLFAFIIAFISLFLFNMIIICKLKTYEFSIAKYCNKINENKYLVRGLFWKVGGFCRYLEIEMLPLNVEQLWLWQTEQGKKLAVQNILKTIDDKK